MSKCELIHIPYGYIISSEAYGSFGETLEAIKIFRRLVDVEKIGVLALQLDRRIQALLDEAHRKNRRLPPVCGDDSLIVEKGGDFYQLAEGYGVSLSHGTFFHFKENPVYRH